MVECKRCHVQIPVRDTTFDANGDYLCRKCTDVVDLSQQLNRAEQERMRNIAPAFSLSGILRRWLEVRRARKEHARMVAAMPNLDALPTHCMSCGAGAPRGRSLCLRCQPA